MKSTKAHGMLSWITGKGTYNENKFDEDAEKVIEYYRNKGYIRRARRPARDQDPRGQRRQGNALGRAEHPDRRRPALSRRQVQVRRQQDHQDRSSCEPLFKLKTGDWYSDKPIRNGLVKAREVLRQPRLLRVHGLPGSRAGRRRPKGRSPVRRSRPST